METMQKLLGTLLEFEQNLRLARRTANERLGNQTIKKLYPLLDQIFTEYKGASSPERVDVHLGFDSRPELLTALTGYLTNLLDRTQAAVQKNKRPDMEKLLESAVIVDSLFQARQVTERYRAAQNRLREVAKTQSFKVETYTKLVTVGVKEFAQRAMILERSGDQPNAAKALGRALEISPELCTSEKAIQLAVAITGKREQSAIQTISDPLHRKAFVDEFAPVVVRKIKDDKPSSRLGDMVGIDFFITVIVILIFCFGGYLAVEHVVIEWMKLPTHPPLEVGTKGIYLMMSILWSGIMIFSGLYTLWKRETQLINLPKFFMGFTFGLVGRIAYYAVDGDGKTPVVRGGIAVAMGLSGIISGIIILMLLGAEYNYIPLELTIQQFVIFYLLGYWLVIAGLFSALAVNTIDEMF